MVCCLLLVMASSIASALPEAKEPAPDFQLQSQTGTLVSLKSYKASYVILFFFGDHSTNEVHMLTRDMQRDLVKYAEFHAAIIGVGRTSPESNEAWAEKDGLAFPLLSDPDQAVANAYGVPSMASSSGKGTIYEVIVAPGGKVILPRITSNDFEDESTRLLACLEYFKDHSGQNRGR
jgi:peroxiredoxin